MSDWERVSQSKPCPVCEKPDWCGVATDGSAVCCMRIESKKPLDNGGWLHRLNGLALESRRAVPTPKRHTPQSFPTAAAAVESLESKHGARTAAWTYCNADGEPVGWVIRWDGPNGKLIRPVSKRGDGWISGGMLTPRPLYRLPELSSVETVFIAEGEKTADALAELGFVATTSAHGSKSAKGANWKPLAGKECVILPDNDAPGQSYAEIVAAILAELSPAPAVKIVTLPSLPERGDAVEFIAAKRAAGADDDVIRAEIEALADAAEVVAPKAKPTNRMPGWRSFPTDALPEPLRNFVASVAVAVGCDESFVALSALAMLASCIGNTRRIKLKRGWSEPALIWAAIIAASGDKKTPAFKAVLRPLRKVEQRLWEEHEAAVQQYNAALTEWKSRKGDPDRGAEPKAPVPVRVNVNDVTIEALAPILQENWRGVLLHRDELSAWFGSFDRYRSGKGGDCPNWLSIFGCETITIDRKTGVPRTIYVPRPNVSICGTIQPGTLARVLTAEYLENGLASRFLFARPPRREQGWTEAEVPEAVEAAFENMVCRLRELEPGTDDKGRPFPILIPVTREAKSLFIGFVNRSARERMELTGPLAAAWSKLEGYAARLALIVECVRGVVGGASLEVVDDTSMRAGIVLADWFKHEAMRVYAAFSETPEDAEERQLVEWIQARGGSVTVRELTHGQRQYRNQTDAARAALDGLAEGGHGEWIESPVSDKGGRPSRRFQLDTAVTVTNTPSEDTGSAGFGDGDARDAPEDHSVNPRDNGHDDLPPNLQFYAHPEDSGSFGYRRHLAGIRRAAAASKRG